VDASDLLVEPLGQPVDLAVVLGELGEQPRMLRCVVDAEASLEARVVAALVPAEGPVPAGQKALERTGVKNEQIDLFELTEALPAEKVDVHLAELPRLRFHFDRRSLGRLRRAFARGRESPRASDR